jgi:two-component system alkaline phosphatase synthesis response regulator PhoP
LQQNKDIRLLLCEPNTILQTVLEFRLRKYGIKLIRTEAAREALRYIHIKAVDVVVMNAQVPDIKTRTFLELVRQDMNIDIPIIIMAALDDENTVLEALEAGADDFVGYPFRPSELILRINRLLQQKKSSYWVR